MKNFYAETKITHAYARAMRDAVIPDRIHMTWYEMLGGLISEAQAERRVSYYDGWISRFDQKLKGRRS
jgi:hypothetical protein